MVLDTVTLFEGLEVQPTNQKFQSLEILGTGRDLVVRWIATANNLSNTPE